MGDDRHTTVKRRRVFYIPGYDPFHPLRYRELYRQESATQAAISGYDIAVKPPATKGSIGWRIAATMGGQTTDTTFEVLGWADLAKHSMSNSIAATYGQMITTGWIYLRSRALWPLMRLRKGPVLGALYPVAMLLAQLALALLAGWGLFRLSHWAGQGGALWSALGGLAGLALAVALLRWFRARDGKLFAYYLMHDYAYTARLNGAYPPDLESRLSDFRNRLSEALTDDTDEILLVGHSSGAHLAISLMADLLRAPLPDHAPALSLLTLGHVVPMVSFLPAATRLRADLACLSTDDRLTWVDVTAPGDGCTYALCDPVAVSGLASPGQRWPLILSASFTQTLSPDRWKALRWRFFRLHFQYLCAFDRPRDYDYFAITAGPQTLGARFAGRPPSPSRLTRALSPHTGTTA